MSEKVLKDIADEMSHEMFRCGTHPAIGVDVVIVESWRDRLAALASSPTSALSTLLAELNAAFFEPGA